MESVLCQQAGRAGEAEDWYRRAADAGNVSPMFNLGQLHEQAGRANQAEYWYHRVSDVGDTGAVYNLSLVLQKAGARRGGDTVVVAGSRGRAPRVDE